MQSCVIELTEAARKHGNLNIRVCGKDFFPADIFGGSSRKAGTGVPIVLEGEGLADPVRTDIPTDNKTGRPRWIYRERKWVREFLNCHELRTGDKLIIERVGEREYKIRLDNGRGISCQTNVWKSGGDLFSSGGTKRSVKTPTKNQRLLRHITTVSEMAQGKLDARRLNILNSPKKGGSSTIDSIAYLEELGVEIIENAQPIQFTPNASEHIHRWAPYVQGFSARFVQTVLDKYRKVYKNPTILDPFAGCGTVLVQAKLNGFKSVGTELNPLLQFIAETKLNSWDVRPNDLLKTYRQIPKHKFRAAPSFLKSTSQFRPAVLRNLETINAGIYSIRTRTEKQRKIKDLLKLAFSAILVGCSNLKRSPCLGYVKNKIDNSSAPFALFPQKTLEIADDLQLIHNLYKDFVHTQSRVICANAMAFKHRNKFDLAITSPPYMNGLDYIMNYKIEMGWLEFVHSQRDLKTVKDDMVVCDNVSKGLIRKFYTRPSTYTNAWIEKIKGDIKAGIVRRGAYRRPDMPYIVHKYFDDMYKVMRNVVSSLKSGGRFVLVVGDSLIADVYVPTDLLIAKIGFDLGLKIERIEKARERRSGQIRSYKLRESITTLLKR